MVKIKHFSYLLRTFLLLSILLLPVHLTDGNEMVIPTASITVDGSADDWNGLMPVSIGSSQQADIKKNFLAKKDNTLYFLFELKDLPDTSGKAGYRLWFDNNKNGALDGESEDRQISVAYDSSKGGWYVWLQKMDGTKLYAYQTVEVKNNYIEGSVSLDLFGVAPTFKLSSGVHSENGYENYYQGPTVDLSLSNENKVTPVSANIVIDGNPADWNGIKPIMTDPEGDGANVQGSDLKALYAFKDSNFLYLMLEVYNNPNGASERVQYIFEISNTADSPFLKWDYQPGGDAQGGTWLWNLTEYDTRVNYKNPNPDGLTLPIPDAEAMGRTVFEMKVPLLLIGNPENMIIRARTVAGEDKWADDMPSAKFITNPSLIQKSADTKTSTPVSTLLPPSAANQDNASKGNSDWNLIGGGIFIVIIVGIIISIRNRTSPKIEYDPDFPENTASGIEIRRGYFVLQNNDIKFGVRITNNTDYAILDADSILDYTKTLFSMKDPEIQHLGNITPNNSRTAAYILKPLGCIHNEQINALVTYKDHTGKKQTLHMRPKEVHCVCPFLKEKPMSEGEYSRLAASSELVQEGISFKGISVEELAKFMGETCRHMLYKVREYDLDGKKIIYLSGESLGEKAYYLLTAVIQEYKGLTQVVLRAHSDKKYGLNGFMNEMADSIRHLVGSVQNAKEIGIIENTQVINIIDSVVQRTNFNMGEGGTQVDIRDSMVQRSKIGGNK